MSNGNAAETPARLLCLKDPLECVVFEGETVFYSDVKNSYFGVSGAAADILTVAKQFPAGLSRDDILAKVAQGRLVNDEEKELISQGIDTLFELGAFHEK